MLSQLILSHAATRTANAESASAQNPVAPLTREILQEQTCQRLRKAIRYGCFLSGQAMTVCELAATLGASPMPARETVRRLAQETRQEVPLNCTMRAFAQPTPVRGTCYRAAGSETLVSGHRGPVAAKRPPSGAAHSPARRRLGPAERLCPLPSFRGARRADPARRGSGARGGERRHHRIDPLGPAQPPGQPAFNRSGQGDA
jgi:hypothetical protein